MTATATAHEGRLHHELALHDGPERLLELMVAFVQDGVSAGDHVVVLGEPGLVGAVTRAVPDVPGVQMISQPAEGRHPARDLHRFVRLLHDLEGDDAPTRIVNQMPRMTRDSWREWRRYEAAVNVTLAPFAVRGTCAYDTRGLSADTLEDLLATHPEVLTAGGTSSNEAFDRFDEHVAGYLGADPHPRAGTAPTLTLDDPSPAHARSAVRRVATGAGLDETEIEAAVLATSEAVSNAHRHGRPPVVLRAWIDASEVTVGVSDTGAGPDPLVGLLPQPPRDAGSGRGMAIVHNLLGDVHHRVSDDGYTITFSVGGS